MPLLFVFVLFTFGGHEIMITNHNDLQLIGETVTVSYVANPSMSHGQFRLENHGAGNVTAAVESVWLELGEDRQPLPVFTLFDLDQDKIRNPESLTIDAGETIRFLIGFPVIVHEPRFGESTTVGLRIKVNGTVLETQSPIRFVRRIPSDQ